MADDEKTSRIQLDFNAEAMNYLEDLKHRLGAEDSAELIRVSLRMVKMYLDHREQGFEMAFIKRGEDKILELEIVSSIL